LDIANRDFEGTVDLEGANQLGDWQTILRDYRILDVSKNGNPYRFTTVNFNSSSYRYYRVSINGIEKLSLINVSSNVLSKERRDTMFFNGVLQELPKLKRFPKTSVYDFKLAEDVLIDQLNFAISDTLRYVRKVEIQILQDSFPQGDEMRYRYRTIGSGSVSSFDTPQVVGFTATVSDRLRILVHNQDSQPLELVGVTAAVEQPRINVRFSGGKRYFLAFGCNSFLQSKPHYDVGQELAAHHGRPPSLNLVTLNSFAVQSSQDPIKGLLTNQLWLYAALVLIAVLLGWMAIGMMKK